MNSLLFNKYPKSEQQPEHTWIRAAEIEDALTALFVSMTDFIFRKVLLLSVYRAMVIQVRKALNKTGHIAQCKH
jgi:hypothetical protein